MANPVYLSQAKYSLIPQQCRHGMTNSAVVAEVRHLHAILGSLATDYTLIYSDLVDLRYRAWSNVHNVSIADIPAGLPDALGWAMFSRQRPNHGTTPTHLSMQALHRPCYVSWLVLRSLAGFDVPPDVEYMTRLYLDDSFDQEQREWDKAVYEMYYAMIGNPVHLRGIVRF